ncbi:MAG TPA: FecR domain-containing protein [Lacunisphaera sp.]
MNRVNHQHPSDNAIEAQAAAWLAQRDDGLTPDEEATFARWRESDPRHAAAVARLEKMWQALGQLRDFRPAARVHPDRDLLAPPSGPRRFFPAAALAVAAVLMIALVVQKGRVENREPLDATKVYSTTAAGYQRLTLADGSIVELNERSEVTVHYTAAERRIRLVRGEAHFTVAKNKARPFFVETPVVAVRAVGTAFDVRLEATQVAVLVTEGRVQLQRHDISPLGKLPGVVAAGAEPPELGAGWRALVPNRFDASLVVEQLPTEQARAILSWQSPSLYFVDTPLSDVIEQFNRRNHVQLSLADPALASIPVGGRFGAENVEAFVRLLTSNGDIVVERSGPDRIILRRAHN